MCRYRKSLFICNHAQIAPERMITCALQKDFQNGEIANGCEVVETHPRNTIRVSTLCANCSAKKDTTDATFKEIKEKMAIMRKHLDESYDGCMKALDEVGLEPERKPENKPESKPEDISESKPESKLEEVVPCADGVGSEPEKTDDSEDSDPVKAFLRRKMTEEHSHLMMLGSV
ncbi:hypothetical protein F5Y18DRAFT_415069 [Xylariaceae sp. FL1019]|nr:hypothetical protein F5Y18DRAFT_415069 [Xylariaceae sp. FL1019]